MPPKRSTRKSATTQDPKATEGDLKENNIEETDDMDEDSDTEFGFESALEDPFSGESDYYQPSDDDEVEEEEEEEDDDDDEEDGMQQNFQGMGLDNREYDGFDDDEEVNERQFEQIMTAATTNDSKVANSNLESLWDVPEEDMQEFERDLAITTGIGKAKRHKGKGRGGPREHPLTPEIKAMLGDANQHYIDREYAEAIELYQEIVRQDSKVHSAWVNLGMIQEELGNPDKALLLKMVAAHLRPKDVDTWKSLASASIELGVRHQAIYCLKKVLSVNPKDADALWDRSFLLKEDGKTEAAILGFTELLEITPHHVKVIDELAKLYRSKDDLMKAIELYEGAMDYHFENDNLDEADEADENVFRYTEINMLTELYIMVNQYEKALLCIKFGILYLQRRIDEIDWDSPLDPEDHDEDFDSDPADPTTAGYADFPMELRARMAVCRIHLGHFDVAKKHVGYLLNAPVTEYSDLYQEVAAAYMEKAHYDLALKLLQAIIDAEDAVDVDVLVRSGDCYREVGELETAIQFYNAVLEEQTDNLDVMMALAQVYEEIGEEEKAFDLVTQVMRRNRENRRLLEVQGTNTTTSSMSPTQEIPGAGSIFDEALITEEQRNKQYQMRAAQRAREKQREEERTEWTKRSFASLNEIKKRIETSGGTDVTASSHFMDEARILWEEFSNVKALYPADKTKKFIGFKLKRPGGSRWETEADMEGELHQMAIRLAKTMPSTNMPEDSEEAQRLKELQEEQRELEEKYRQIASATGFRGISFTEWLDTFITYCFMLTNSGSEKEAYRLLTRLGDANVFYHDPQRRLGLKLTIIACAILADDYATVYEVVRSITGIYQFNDDGYKLYTALLSNGTSNITWYAPSMTVKYLVRQVKLVDKLIREARKADTGETMEEEELEDLSLSQFMETTADLESSHREPRRLPREKYPRKPFLSLLLLLGSVLQMGKAQTAAIIYYSRAYTLCPNEPLLSLLLGVAYLSRAIQRITDNRHLQIVQGFTFLYKYYERRKEMQYAQEAEYNIARAFHTINLTHLAIPYYERALVLPSRKLVLEVGKEEAMRGHKIEDLLEAVYDWEIPHPWHDIVDDETDLRSEAAYNLHLIYVTSGTPGLSQMLMMKYCTV